MEANEWRGVTTGWRRASRGRPVQEYENIKKIMKQRRRARVARGGRVTGIQNGCFIVAEPASGRSHTVGAMKNLRCTFDKYTAVLFS